ncbi:uncharacterized protein [Clytia hemisphaerica]|uniref:Uncharacterized protein n=1 Tax=Clytia hemisphaerica TaxID=252671 RepID=A0A7M5V1Y1_9CNID
MTMKGVVFAVVLLITWPQILIAHPCETLIYFIPEEASTLYITDCSSKDLTTIPDDLPTNITALHLSYNLITSWDPDSLRKYPNLQYINLDYNPIVELKDNAFSNMSALEEIHIAGGRIAKINKNAFQHLPKLEVLNLEYNQLESIKEDDFDNVKNLREILLTGNRLSLIDKNAFNETLHLEALFLDLNRLESLDDKTFYGLLKLNTLHLASNKLTSVPSSISDLKALTKLDLSYNSFTKYPLFKEMNQLLELDLMGCSIKEIESSNLKKTPNLLKLRLNRNNLKKIGIDQRLDNLRNLKELILLGNQIEEIDERTFGFNSDSIEVLNLGRNNLPSLKEKVFQPLKNLKELSLTGNGKLLALPQKLLSQNSKLKTLYLSKIGLTALPTNVVKNLGELENLYINDNRIFALNDDVFSHLKSLKLLQLDNNQIEELTDKHFANNSQLTELFISDNSRFKTIHKDAFKQNMQMKRLHLRKNNLGVLDEHVFQSLYSLTELNLRENKNIKELKNNLFRYNDKLQILDLTDTSLEKISPITFERQTRLHSIRGKFQMDCTYKSLNQMRDLRRKNILKDENFSCALLENVKDSKALENAGIMEGYFNSHRKAFGYIDRSEVYISKNGSRGLNCGSIENPCQRIDDVLFDRKRPVTIYLEAAIEVDQDFEERVINASSAANTTSASERFNTTSTRPSLKLGADVSTNQIKSNMHIVEYKLLLPLNILTSVTFKRYSKNKDLKGIRPIVTTKYKTLFVMRSNGFFIIENVDFILPENGVLLDVDSEGDFLEKVVLRNTDISSGDHKNSVVAVRLNIYQGIGDFVASNVNIQHGTLLRLKGNIFLKSSPRINNINGTFQALNVSAVHILQAVDIQNYQTICNINKIKIKYGKKIAYGLYFNNAICNIADLSIKNVTIKNSAILVKTAKNSQIDDLRDLENIGRYMYNFPDTRSYATFPNNFKFEKIKVTQSTMTNILEISNFPRALTVKDGFYIMINEFQNGIEITQSDFEATNMRLIHNDVRRNMLSQNKGSLSLTDVLIKENKATGVTKAIAYQAEPNSGTQFKLKNMSVDWEHVNSTHPPLLDLFLSDGHFEIDNVNVTSYSSYDAVTASIEVEANAESKKVKSFMNNFRTDCTHNLQARKDVDHSIRGRKLEMSCVACEIKMYTKQKSYLKVKTKIGDGSTKDDFRVKPDIHLAEDDNINFNILTKIVRHSYSKEFQCKSCPVGGSCKNGIKSSGNFYGFTKVDGTVAFTACPRAYCCTKQECVDINSCRQFRNGTLCGSCIKGYQEDFFSDRCVTITSCKNTTLFWVFFIMVALVVCIFFLFLKDITLFLKSIPDRLKACFGKELPASESTDFEPNKENLDENEEDGVIENGLTDSKMKDSHKTDSDGVAIIERESIESSESEDERHLTTSGAFNIVVGFYQIRSLLTVDVGTKYRRSNTYQAKLTQIMNLDFNFIRSLCPLQDLTAIGEGFIRNQLILVIMLGWAFLFLIIYFVLKVPGFLKRTKSKNDTQIEFGSEEKQSGQDISLEEIRKTRQAKSETENSTAEIEISAEKINQNREQNNLTVPQRIGLGMIKIILFGYKNVSTFAIICFHCVDIKGSSVLFINGNEKCFQPFQYAQMVFVGLWCIPFPVALMFSYRLYMRYVISLRKLVLFIVFPCLAPFYFTYLLSKGCFNETVAKQGTQDTVAIDEKRVTVLLKEMFEEAYRKRKGKEYYVFWETWRLYQRLILAFVSTFAINPVNRICYATPIILFFIFVYWYVKPYKKQYYILHWMEVIGLLGITFTLVNNMFRSFLYVFDIPDQEPIPTSLSVLWGLDTIASPIFVLVFYYLVKPLFEKIISLIFSMEVCCSGGSSESETIEHGSI